MSGKRFSEIGKALSCGDSPRAANLARAILTSSDTTATRAGVARSTALTGLKEDHIITLSGFGHTSVVADALIAYGLCEELIIAIQAPADCLAKPRVFSTPTTHLVRIAADSNPAALESALQAYPGGRVFLVPDPDIEIPASLAAYVNLSASTLRSNSFSDWIDERRLGDDLPMLTPLGAKSLAIAAINYIRSQPISNIKLVVTDLDDTLWGGVLGEDGPEGLDMKGRGAGNFAAYQKGLARLVDQGVLLACVSRNNIEDIETLFSKSTELHVQRKDFFAIRASWNSKSGMIQSLLHQTQVAPEAAVFIDNDPMERGQVAAAIPGLLIPEDGDRSATCLARLEREGRFMMVSSDDRYRKESTHAAIQFKEIVDGGGSRDALLASLDMRISFENVNASNRERALQLAARVTQFRTASTPKDWETRHHAFLLRLEETGIDHGRVGMMVWRQEGEAAMIELLCLSCRVLNRDIETALLAEVAGRAEVSGLRFLIGRTEQLSRNAPGRDVYIRHGFRLTEPGLYLRNVSGIEVPKHLSLNGEDERDGHNEHP